jgi:hypothetical protein
MCNLWEGIRYSNLPEKHLQPVIEAHLKVDDEVKLDRWEVPAEALELQVLFASSPRRF